MHLASVETFLTAPPGGIGGSFWVLVRLTTDDGITGLGECYGIPVSGDIAAAMVVDTFDRYLAGEDPHRVETMFRRVYSAGFTQRPDVSMMGVFSGMEMAMWDILGKAHGRPVCDLLGGRFHDQLRAYTYLYPASVHDSSLDPSADGDPYHDPAVAAERALAYVDQGFTAVKQDPSGPYAVQGGRELSLHELSRSEANIAAIREALGDRADILVGTHGQMTTSSAIRLAKKLERFDPLWYEEPCPPDQPAALGRVAASTSIPVAAGERLTTRSEFHTALQHGVSILQPNVGRSGGLWETRKIAAMAELFNAQVAPHIYCGPVAQAAAAHLGFTCPNFLLIETIDTAFHRASAPTSLRYEGGRVLAPTEPGLGIELDEDVLAAHPYETGGRLHLDMTQAPLPSDNTLTVDELTD